MAGSQTAVWSSWLAGLAVCSSRAEDARDPGRGAMDGSANDGTMPACTPSVDGPADATAQICQAWGDGCGRALWATRVVAAPRFCYEYGAGSPAVAPGGDLFLAGNACGRATFGDGEATGRVVDVGDSSAFVARYGPDGCLRWVRQIGGIGAAASAFAFAFGGPDFVVVVGTPGEGRLTIEGGNAPDVGWTTAWTDAFVASYSAEGHRWTA